jgi:CRISPR-associated endonuclease/helicase Cas3
MCAFALMHDVGKFSWRFQSKVAACYPPLLGQWRAAPPSRHTTDGALLWQNALHHSLASRLWSPGDDRLSLLLPAVFGHHGSPARADRYGDVNEAIGGIGIAVAHECLGALFSLLGIEAVEPAVTAKLERATWWVSGVLTLSDWLGSQSQVFSFDPGSTSLDLYWEKAKIRAKQVVISCGLVPPPAAPRQSFAALTGSTWMPTPVQELASTLPLPDGPTLYVIEDVTGSGKTEAAQMLVHRMLASGRASGAFWAMPTQATANAMYVRQSRTLAHLFQESKTRPSLVLAHGQSNLHDGFRSTVIPSEWNTGTEKWRLTADNEGESGAICHAFLADDRRAAMLATIGAGTVDQAVQGVLPTRFNTVRLLGLADKVLVLDEVHAYDAYLGEEVLRLLAFQAALGGSAVVLTATLAESQWRQLVCTWNRATAPTPPRRFGLSASRNDAVPERSHVFPLMTVVRSAGGTPRTEQHEGMAPEHAHRRLPVSLLRSVDSAIARIVEAAKRGAAVAWIRNTVDSCQQAAEMLRAHGIDVIIFHARFAQGDRQRRESEVVDLFGKPDPEKPLREENRRGRVLLATQVVEQSLDLDFDVLISDLAPIDLIIQRAGRLWRHSVRNADRVERGFEFRLHVLSPASEGEVEATWPNGLLPGTGSVYAAAHYLWLTARVLEQVGEVTSPGRVGEESSVRSLIASVYDDHGLAHVPAALDPRVRKAEGRDAEMVSLAHYLLLQVDNGYLDEGIEWSREVKTPTRFSNDQTTVRLARVLPGGSLVPWEHASGLSLGKRWALSEVRLRNDRVPFGSSAQPHFASAVARARLDMGKWDQEIPVIPLEPAEDGGWLGEIRKPDGRVSRLRYTDGSGVAFAAGEGKV